MNQLDKSDERPSSTSQVVAPPSPIRETSSNEKISDSNIEKSNNFEQSLTTNYSHSKINANSTVPTTCSSEIVTSVQNNLNSAFSNTDKLAKIVVSNETPDSNLLFKSELKTRPGTCVSRPNSSAKRPLVAYEEDEQTSDTAESASVPLVKPSTSEREESSVVKEELSGTESSAPDAGTLVEEQQPSTSTSGASTTNSTSAQKPKTKRVRISIKLDQYSVLRLKRLATENPKLLRKFGLKAYRINNFNGTSNKYQLVKVPRNQPKPIQPTLLKPGRRQTRTTSSTSSVTTPTPIFGTQSPTRYRQPFIPQRTLSNFEFVKGVAAPNYLMDQQRPQQQQQQFSANYPPQQRPQQLPQRYSAPPAQQQAIRQQMGQPEPGPSNASDNSILVGLLNNNPQTTPQGTSQQMRYPPPQQQQQQMAPPQMMQTQGYPPQQQQQMGHPGQHMMPQQHNPYFQPQRMPQQMVPNGAQPMQPMPNQPQMIPNQGPPNMQQPPQQPEPMQKPAKTPRKRQTKKQKEEAKKQEDQRKMQMQMSNQHMAQHVPQDYYMMQQQRMPMQPAQMQRMQYPPQYSQGYPQQQASTSMMQGNYGGYPQQMWQQMPPPEYQMQMHQQMMRPPPNGQQTPGTPTSNYPVQSPSYPPQKMRMQTPQGYPQPPQYPMQHQQVMNRQFMSPPNHPSPSYGQAQGTPTQFSYSQPQAAQMMQQQAQTPQSQQNQNQPTNIEEFAQFEYGGSTFEDIGGLDDLGGEDCDLDSITPMNVEMPPTNPAGQQIHQHQMNQQMQNQGHQMGMMPPQQNMQQQFDSHQFAHPQMTHQQSPMGANQNYHASPGYQQQFQRPQSPQRYMQHVPQQMMQHQSQTSNSNLGFSDSDFFHDAEEGKSKDLLPHSPPKGSLQQQRAIEATVEWVMAKDETYFVKYFDDYKNKVDDTPPAPASKRKSKSTNSRPPSRQPKNSQSSSTANTPTPGPIFGHSSASTEPSTPIKEEPMDYKDYKTERKNSTLSTLLSGNSTPTIKSEENGIPDSSLAGISSPTVRSERDTTTTPVSTVSTPQSDVGVVKIENNNGNEQYSRFNGHTVHEASNPSNEAIALKTKQESPDDGLMAAADSTDAALMPPPFKKMHKSEDVMEDNSAKYFDGANPSELTFNLLLKSAFLFLNFNCDVLYKQLQIASFMQFQAFFKTQRLNCQIHFALTSEAFPQPNLDVNNLDSRLYFQ
uniref:Uncharacterized protein n=1 Tax=Panagrolaimus sp. JU765 TaxID=591449 RepID=A0AC34RJY8_9BILA